MKAWAKTVAKESILEGADSAFLMQDVVSVDSLKRLVDMGKLPVVEQEICKDQSLVNDDNFFAIVPSEQLAMLAKVGKSWRQGKLSNHVVQRKFQKKQKLGDKRPSTRSYSISSQ